VCFDTQNTRETGGDDSLKDLTRADLSANPVTKYPPLQNIPLSDGAREVVYQVVGYYVTRECASCGIL